MHLLLLVKIVLLGLMFISSSSLSIEESSDISAVGDVLSSRDQLSVTNFISLSSSRQWYILLEKLGVGINLH